MRNGDPQVSLRLPRGLLEHIEDIADAEGINRSAMAVRLLDLGLSAYCTKIRQTERSQ